MKRVASYALFTGHPQYGHRELYWQCIPAVVRAHHNFYEGWEMRIYHDSSVNEPYGEQLRSYAAAGLVTLVHHEENIATCRSMLWRLLPLWDADAGYLICRDMDSLPTAKDRAAVDEFIASGKLIHELCDNDSHSGLMGGMVGFAPGVADRLCAQNVARTWDDFLRIGDLNHEFPMHVPSGGPDQILMNRVLPSLFSGEIHSRNYRGNPVGTERTDELSVAIGKLVPHLGAPGFDVATAIALLDAHGLPEVAERARQAMTSTSAG
jgi:hypothetical protein